MALKEIIQKISTDFTHDWEHILSYVLKESLYEKEVRLSFVEMLLDAKDKRAVVLSSLKFLKALSGQGYFMVKADNKKLQFIFRHVNIEKLNNLVKVFEKYNTKKSLVLSLNYNYKTREIKINKILFARPNFDSPNHSLFEFLYDHLGKEFSRDDIKKELRMQKCKSFNSFLNEINIKGKIRKYLFNCSKGKIILYKKARTTEGDFERIKQELEAIKSRNE